MTAPETPTPSARTWMVELPAGMKLLNANRRIHYMRRAELTRTIRTAAWAAVRNACVPNLWRVHVIVEYRPPDRRRRDVHNLFPSAKAAVDGGLVDTGVLPDDSDRHLVGPDMRVGEVEKGGRLVLHITELEAAR